MMKYFTRLRESISPNSERCASFGFTAGQRVSYQHKDYSEEGIVVGVAPEIPHSAKLCLWCSFDGRVQGLVLRVDDLSKLLSIE